MLSSSSRRMLPIASRVICSRQLTCLTSPASIGQSVLRVAASARPQAQISYRQFTTLPVIIPPLGESVKDGSLGSFSKKVGDFVQAEEEVVQIETDKITHSLTAPKAGKITKILFSEGATVEVGQVVFEIDTSVQGPAASQKPAAAAAPAPPTPTPAAAPAKPAAAPQQPAKPQSPPPQQQPQSQQRTVVLPPPPPPPKPAVTHVLVPGSRETKRVPMSRMRQKIAQRLKDAQNTTAMLTTFNEIDMTNATAMRGDLKDDFANKHGLKLGFMSFFVKASVAALQAQPSVNAYIEGDEIVYNEFCDISVAVATPNGLVVPVLRNCEGMSLADVERGIASLGERARNGQLTLADMSGGTFTISNGGVFGSMFGTPIINPPQSAILGMHAIKDRVVAVNGKVEVRPIMYVALTYDHRIIDGREAATCLKTIKDMVEDPRRLLLDL